MKCRLLILITIIIAFSVFSCSTPPRETSAVENENSSEEPVIENLRNIQNSFRAVSAEVLPAVVEVAVVEIKKQLMPEGEDTPLWPWNFGPSEPGEGPKEQEFRNEGFGSGVIVRKEENKVYILTNNHVVGDADEIEITFYDKRNYPGKIVGKDDRKDLALVVIETDEEDIPVARLGDSDSLFVGDWVLAIGNPFGFNSTVTAGIVSAKGRSGPTEISNYIQTDASINQGNSGGALVNIDGEVVGINTWIAAPTGGNIGLGFSIPINNAKKAIDDFIHYGEVEYGWLGVSIADPLPSLAKEMNLNSKNGAFIYHVFRDSPADKGGLQPGDYVIRLNDIKIMNANQLVMFVGEFPPNKKAEFTIIRGGEVTTIELKIGKRQDRESITALNKKLWPGIAVVPMNDEIKKELSIPESIEGVFVSEVQNKTKIQIAGIKLGDIITEINEIPVKNVMDFYQILNDIKNKEVKIRYYREGSESVLLLE